MLNDGGQSMPEDELLLYGSAKNFRQTLAPPPITPPLEQSSHILNDLPSFLSLCS